MELGGHDVVRVAGEDGDTVAGCAVPYANSLIVRGGDLEGRLVSISAVKVKTHNPGHFMVELDGTNIV